jgi:hypothetical protein
MKDFKGSGSTTNRRVVLDPHQKCSRVRKTAFETITKKSKRLFNYLLGSPADHEKFKEELDHVLIGNPDLGVLYPSASNPFFVPENPPLLPDRL